MSDHRRTVDHPKMMFFFGRLPLDLEWTRRAGIRFKRSLDAREALAQRFMVFLRAVSPLKKGHGFADHVRVADRRLFRWCEATFTEKTRAATHRSSVALTRAIHKYEAFVARHPADKTQTPDLLLLLAELYLEKAEMDFRKAHGRYIKRLETIRRKSRHTQREVVLGPKAHPALFALPPRPIRHFSQSLAYCRQILRRFPGYRNREQVIYLLGVVLRLAASDAESSDDERLWTKAREYHSRARQAFLGLVCANRYAPVAAPRAVAAPAGYTISITSKAAARDARVAFARFDPYQGCQPSKPTKTSSQTSKNRRRLLSQSWLLIGEEHFYAEPSASLTPSEQAKVKRDLASERMSGENRDLLLRSRRLEALSEKELRMIRLHYHYAKSAYARVIGGYSDLRDYYHAALYKRAWTHFKTDQYLAAARDFDNLLKTVKDAEYIKNAVRYLALCAYYQKQSRDPHRWLLAYYRANKHRHTHVKAIVHQLAEVLWEEALPSPDYPGVENYGGELLERALKIYRWILDKGGLTADSADAGNPDRDWKYYRHKAPIQVRILQILGILQANFDKRVRARHPPKQLVVAWKRAFSRFCTYRECAHVAYAKAYERRWGRYPRITQALAILRRTNFLNTGKGLLIAALKRLDQYSVAQKRAAQIPVQITGPDGSKTTRYSPTFYRKHFATLQLADGHRRAFLGSIGLAGLLFRFVIDHPHFKNKIQAYEARFYLGLVAYYSRQYKKASRLFGAVERSKISTTLTRKARQWRLRSLQESRKP